MANCSICHKEYCICEACEETGLLPHWCHHCLHARIRELEAEVERLRKTLNWHPDMDTAVRLLLELMNEINRLAAIEDATSDTVLSWRRINSITGAIEHFLAEREAAR